MRKILYIKKDPGDSIQGICKADTRYIVSGRAVSNDAMVGGGFIGEMRMSDNGVFVEIRKTKDGKPHRNFGRFAASKSDNPEQLETIEADGVMFPIARCQGIVFRDEPSIEAPSNEWIEKAKEIADAELEKKIANQKDPPRAQPVQNQQRRQ